MFNMLCCPFCNASPAKLRVVDKWGSGAGYFRPRIAYVRCLVCNARGPSYGKLRYDIRNERPGMASIQLLHDEAIRLWNLNTSRPSSFNLELSNS